MLSYKISRSLCITIATIAMSLGVTAAEITINDSIEVKTDAYTVRFDRGVITYIHNALTGETYTTGEGTSGWTGMLYTNHVHQDENFSTHYRTSEMSATQVSDNHLILDFKDRDTVIQMSLQIDEATGDLLIDTDGIGAAGVVGMQWGISYLDIENVSVILPAEGGRIIDERVLDAYWLYQYPASGWEAQLAIVEGGDGGFFVRNTDTTFQYKRVHYTRRGDEASAISFGTYNQAPFDSHTTGQSTQWRFNVYRGDWRVPARIYRDWTGPAFDARRLSDMPSWVQNINLFVSSATLDGGSASGIRLLNRLAELTDPTRTVVMVSTWADGGDWWEGESHHPDYIPKPHFGEFMDVAHRHGFHIVPWVLPVAVSPDHPRYPELAQYQMRDTWTGELIGDFWTTPSPHPSAHRTAHMNMGSAEIRKNLVDQLTSIWNEYGVAGFFLDATYNAVNDANGLIDGLSVAQGMDRLHRELTAAMPGIILGGERHSEGVFARKTFAQRPTLTDELLPHSISAFLFAPFAYPIAFPAYNPDDRPDLHQRDQLYYDTWGIIPTIKVWSHEQLDDEDLGVQAIIRQARTWWQPMDFDSIPGDVNGDGIVNVIDLLGVAHNFGEFIPPNPRADVNRDGVVDVLDLITVGRQIEQ